MTDTPKDGPLPESRVLIIMTGKALPLIRRSGGSTLLNWVATAGGTISMKRSDVGYVPVSKIYTPPRHFSLHPSPPLFDERWADVK